MKAARSTHIELGSQHRGSVCERAPPVRCRSGLLLFCVGVSVCARSRATPHTPPPVRTAPMDELGVRSAGAVFSRAVRWCWTFGCLQRQEYAAPAPGDPMPHQRQVPLWAANVFRQRPDLARPMHWTAEPCQIRSRLKYGEYDDSVFPGYVLTGMRVWLFSQRWRMRLCSLVLCCSTCICVAQRRSASGKRAACTRKACLCFCVRMLVVTGHESVHLRGGLTGLPDLQLGPIECHARTPPPRAQKKRRCIHWTPFSPPQDGPEVTGTPKRQDK